MRGLASGKPFGRASWHAGRVIAARLKNDLRHQRAGNIRVRAVQVPTGGTTTAMSIGGDHAENVCLDRGGRSSVAALSSKAYADQRRVRLAELGEFIPAFRCPAPSNPAGFGTCLRWRPRGDSGVHYLLVMPARRK